MVKKYRHNKIVSTVLRVLKYSKNIEDYGCNFLMSDFIILNVYISYLMLRYTYIPLTFDNDFFHQSYLSYEFYC